MTRDELLARAKVIMDYEPPEDIQVGFSIESRGKLEGRIIVGMKTCCSMISVPFSHDDDLSTTHIVLDKFAKDVLEARNAAHAARGAEPEDFSENSSDIDSSDILDPPNPLDSQGISIMDLINSMRNKHN